MTVHIPDGFLPPEPPPNAYLQRIDFMTTDPPMPEYNNMFAAVVHNLLTESECQELLRLAEASTLTSDNQTPTWERAMINAGGGRQILAVDSRNCGRIIFDSPELAQRLLYRLMPFFRESGIDRLEKRPLVTGLGPARRGEVLQLSRLNERLRFLRYEGGEYFRPHWDGMYETDDGLERSYFTVHLYLNGEGEQDLEELKKAYEEKKKNGTVDRGSPDAKLLGGATSFVDTDKDDRAVRVFPKTGSVLVFQQNHLAHGGDDVFRGVKYTMRTDVMYRQVKN
ncbi:hypothetical protein VTN96DRAFT_7866 [Rasamsonia emersonii]|uniref:Prolyl 4-hydroxylase alpha subunit domain-containing protein n=1 Tax=Rasamsonia emersonii (strain ATCC 16479 / CBS 393.64 / IMI 116815) TaxID=1408163 RepID=A0A0F4YJT2_RASE3|nr:hypothetical protein T310_7561 [Rasamsonia emersonii CBS 393.64]KKA18484.1 hypothetical protein T310_7561 [Rasamsonia emersonii CBS 393.64]